MSLAEIEKILQAPQKFWQLYQEKQKKPKDMSFVILRDTAIIELIYSAGLRISEALNLDWQSFENFLTINGKGKRQRIVFLGVQR